MADAVFDEIRQYVQERTRLCFSGHKRSLLGSKLQQRVDALALPDMSAYRDILLNSHSEEVVLLDLITTNETCFFRNPRQFDYLRDHILPALEEERGSASFRRFATGEQPGQLNDMRLRILSAGCSTGEEPYTVAMTVLEGLRYPRAWEIDIVAGDLSESCLEIARRGSYETARLKGIPKMLQKKYMDASDDGATFREDVRRLIRFMHLNLNDVMQSDGGGDTLPAGAFDIVLCRNVMIYFSSACQQQLVNSLYRIIAPGGYLLTGDAEPLHLFRHDFTPVREAGCLIYRKTGSNAHDQAV
ncbi:protein-glutamate O-methyltransferase CheR [Geobacter sp. AOG1]|uniref:CheR family methyltransferase n=1 Tax=Geobacter sp. AOG1 TaxID=1566346 RepID=UPI001CC41232|nr:protein-glutamate O-methyltransferase CheR [Geobacter sp. AOG1]GFE58555.1 chemotaxis protein methyltransferase [Geobacter sp. AOG1]